MAERRFSTFERLGKPLPKRVRDQIDSITAQFTTSWRKNEVPPIEPLLEQLPDYRAELFARLLAVEVDAKTRAGQTPCRQDYLVRFPEFVDEIDLQLVGQTLDSGDSTKRNESTDNQSDTLSLSDHHDSYFVEAPQCRDPHSPKAISGWEGSPTRFDGYQILGELGRGGMGVVYRVLDLRRQQVVALKTMLHADPACLTRFKKEFRALADVTHENLAKLYELSVGLRQVFFTMELIEGCDFLTRVRGSGAVTAPLSGTQIRVLTDALRQLCRALIALHDAGKVHRDIKPSNVLVTAAGRVVVVDFGLTVDVEEGDAYQTRDGHVVGTIAYMSPEQAQGAPITTASDWYSVGVLLYMVLTGRLPFEGNAARMLQDKQLRSPVPPSRHVSGLPENLEQLCMSLLSRDIETRPDGRSVLRILGDCESATPLKPTNHLFVGRHAQLEQLRQAYAELHWGRPASVLISGQSGSGKSTLVSQFLAEIREREDVLVFSSRCYGREAVPYKAIDELIDDLSRYLSGLSFEQVDALMPRDVAALSRVFPSLRQVDAILRSPKREPLPVDPLELRLRAFAALREMLTRLGDRKRLVLVIDDLQWGDQDSAAMMGHVFRQPDGPVVLFIGLFRSEDIDTGSPWAMAESFPSPKKIQLEALGREECAQLARLLLPALPGDENAEAMLERIAEESMGSPLFLRELAIGLDKSQARPGEGQVLSFETMLWSRIGLLPDVTRRFLFALAIAGKPMEAVFLVKATGLPSLAVTDSIVSLRSEHLLRDCGQATEPFLDTFHDRVREVIALRLDEQEQRTLHRQLAESSERWGGQDAHFMALHFRAAGMPEKARAHYVTAADEASDMLAFHQAAELYTEALSLPPAPGEDPVSLRIKRAEALSNAGHSLQAANEYLNLANRTEASQSLEMRRRAFTQFQFMGRIDQAKEVLVRICDQIGLAVPRSALTIFGWILLTRLRLSWFGLLRPLGSLPANKTGDDGQVDTYWSITTAMTHVDYLRAAYFSTKHLLAAERLGDPHRLSRALALEAGIRAGAGRLYRPSTQKLLDRADEMTASHQDPLIEVTLGLCKGIRHGCLGEWRDSRAHCGQAETDIKSLRRTTPRSGPNESHAIFGYTALAQFWQLYSLTWLGQVDTLEQRCFDVMEDAQQRSDRFHLVMIGGFCQGFVRIAQDSPALGLAELETTMKGWEAEGFYIQNHMAILGESSLHLYDGRAREARDMLLAHWPRYRSSWMLGAHVVRSHLHDLLVRSSLMSATEAADNRPFLRSAHRSRRWLACERLPWTTALATAYRGCFAAIRRDRQRAVRDFQTAAERFESLGMDLHAAASRLRAGELIAGGEGHRAFERSEQWMLAQGVRNPRKMTRFLLPIAGDVSADPSVS